MAVTFVRGENFNCGTKSVHVWIPAHLSHTGKPRWADKPIDTCIADIVDALVAAGIYTDGCCCAHGCGPGNIILSDGRTLEIHFPDDWEAHCKSPKSKPE